MIFLSIKFIFFSFIIKIILIIEVPFPGKKLTCAFNAIFNPNLFVLNKVDENWIGCLKATTNLRKSL